jgi:mannose-6-phosphate isomerase
VIRPADPRGGSEDLIFLEPVYLTKVWGGSRLREMFGDSVPDGAIGECLAISARPGGDCRVRSGVFAGRTLSRLWAEHRELFGGVEGDAFPLQVKFLDACADLSVQVHPDETYAAAHESDDGKNECWYVLEPSESGRLIVGHNAASRERFAELARAGRWEELLRSVEMARGDFFFIPAGTVHAILAGSLIYEVQQASNVTYRLFDYDRLDDGSPRELHVAKALDVVSAPSAPEPIAPTVTVGGGAKRSLFTRNQYFTLSRWDVTGSAALPAESPFQLVSVLEGSGTVNGERVTAGDQFVAPSGVRRLDVTGPVALLVSGL